MEIGIFCSMLERGHGKQMDSDTKKAYWDVYKIIPTKEKACNVSFKGSDYHTAHHLFEWNMVSKIIEPIFNINGSFIGQNIYFYRSPYEKNLQSNQEA